MKWFTEFLPRLWSNWITLIGTIVTTISGFSLLFGLAIDLASPITNRYTSTLLFMILPAMFVFGLLLIPAGFLWERKRKPQSIDKEHFPLRFAMNELIANPKARRRLLLIVTVTGVNVILFGAAAARGVAYMDSPRFCGTMCHTVMQPEWDSYKASPHAKVKCVSCHIGPGASWAAKAKVDGLRQVWAVMAGSYSTPIPSPVEHLRPARDTCEQCHWPAKFLGNRMATFRHYLDDRENSEEVTVLALKVGGQNPHSKKYHGIHWHVSPDMEIRYEVLDKRRENIGKIEWYEDGKKVGTYDKPGKKKSGSMRTMDCVDCHNRPTHIFDADASAAVDRAISEGRLNSKTPFIKKVATEVLSNANLPIEGLEKKLQDRLVAIYKKEHPDDMPSPTKQKYIAKVLGKLYKRNIFPEMKVTWGTHGNHLGHPGGEEEQNGCFRCHNDEHVNKEGETLSQDCEMCHSLLHWEEPMEDLPDAIQGLFEPHK